MITLDYATAYNAWSNIHDSKLIELKKMLYKAAYRYASIRTEWQFMSSVEQAESDLGRTAAHNHFIDSCNILSRSQLAVGEDNKWRSEIGMERKLIGDFACYVNCFIGIVNR